jgi:hypothetical protein
MALTIHKDIPLPKRTVKREHKYDFASLAEGDCFIEDEVVSVTKVINRLSAAVTNYRKSYGEGAPKFAVRSVVIDGKDAVGVWRVAA